MTATAVLNGGFERIDDHNVVPGMLGRFLTVGAQAAKGQFVTQSPSTGYVALNDGTVAAQISLGVMADSELSDSPTIAETVGVNLWQGWWTGAPQSTIANDSFTDTDFAVPFFIADENTPGKLSSYNGNSRSMGGLVFGIAGPRNLPVLWTGPVAWLLARAAHITNNYAPSIRVLADAATGTTGSAIIPRDYVHGTVTSVKVRFEAAVTASDSNYATLTVYKNSLNSGGTGTTQTTLATITTQTTGVSGGSGTTVALVPYSFTLSTGAGALNLIETDTLTVAYGKTGSGVQLPASVVSVAMQVL